MLAHYSTEALNGAMVAMQAGDVLYYLPVLSLASISAVFVGQMNGKHQFEKTSTPIFQIIAFLTTIWALIIPFILYYTPTIIPESLHKSGCPFFIIRIAVIPIYAAFTALTAFLSLQDALT